MKSQFVCACSHKVLWIQLRVILLLCRICEELIRSKPDLLHGRCNSHNGDLGWTPLLKIFANDVPSYSYVRSRSVIEENHRKQEQEKIFFESFKEQEQEKYVKIIDTLIDMGAELDARDDYGYNALHYIAENSLTHLGKLFIRRLQEASEKSEEILWYPEWVVNATNKEGKVS